MKLELDTGACQGHGRCYSLAPELFDADDEGHSVLLAPDVPPDKARSARDAVQSCPEDAISLSE
jgi:ferredoxin